MADVTTQYHMLSSMVYLAPGGQIVLPVVVHLQLITDHKSGTAAASGLESNCENDQRSEWRHYSKYVASFTCLVMSSIWWKVLVTIN